MDNPAFEQQPKVKISVIIPCLNEAGTIGKAVQEARVGIRQTGMSGEIIVIDNGSMDQSSKLAQQAGARVVTILQRGYGSAIRGGLANAEGEYILFADADLSYPLKDMVQVLQPLFFNQADLVVGNRLNKNIEKYAMPKLHRYFGTPILNYLIRIIHGLKIKDCNSGMRAVNQKLIKNIQFKSTGMEFASEMLLKAQHFGYRIKEVDISFRRDQRMQASHLRPIRDGLRHLMFILNWWLEKPASPRFSLKSKFK